MKSRKSTKRALAVAVLAAIGTAGIGMNTASANVIADGAYNLVINTTPIRASTPSTGSAFKIGKDGSWNSSFTFGGNAPGSSSQGMTDNGTLSSGHGSGIAGDGWAGIMGITVTGGTFTVNGVSSMSGTIDQATGDMTLDPTGRLGAINSPVMVNLPWNIDNCTLGSTTGCSLNSNTTYQTLSTVSATAVNGTGTATTIKGAAFTPITGGYKGILVSGGQVGSTWGSFFGAGYFETWNVDLLSTTTPHSGYNVDTILGTAGGDFAEYVAPVPIPAAAWLFGSGLLGLVGIARRKKSS